MTEKRNRNKLSGFLRYRGNKMSYSERNAFERELQKDPFLEEAAEGFAMIEPEDASKDIIALHKKLKARTSGNKKLTYYRIVASVAVLMIISSVFIVLDRSQFTNLRETEILSDTITINKQQVFRKKFPVSSENTGNQKKSGLPTAKKIQEKESGKDENTISEVENSMIEEKSAEIYTDDSEELNARSEPSEQIVAAPSSSYGNKESKSSRSVRLSEASPGYTKAIPVNGTDSFNTYIEKSIKVPDRHPDGLVITVKLNFKVTETGMIDSIKVLDNPGEDYSKEAVRLLKEGPAWKSAEEYGNPVEEEVTLDIIFR